jgi:serine kinase of HPr protein (carbohydrate metabolism regulator)
MIMQASAVAIAGRALLIEGAPGSGKSSLALALIDRGAALIGDDGVTLTRGSGGALIAAPPPNIAGLIELRGIGIVRLEAAPPAPLALILSLVAPGDPAPERLPDAPARRTLLGSEVPVLSFDPGETAPAVRAEWALQIHGLDQR